MPVGKRRRVCDPVSAWLSPSLASGGAWTLLSAPGIGAAGLRPLFAGGALKAILENSGGGGSGGSGPPVRSPEPPALLSCLPPFHQLPLQRQSCYTIQARIAEQGEEEEKEEEEEEWG